MTDVFTKLAEKLDGLPNGYPKTETGIELKILSKIFSEEEAEIALELKPRPETVQVVAERIDLPEEKLKEKLIVMADKGQIGRYHTNEEPKFMLIPFIIGIYEYQVDRIDAELAEMFEEYAPVLFEKLGHTGPAISRVVPANISIKPNLEVHTYDDMRGMINSAKSFALRECICRKEKELTGEKCSHELETCIGFSNKEGALEQYTYSGRIISREEALDVIDKAEKAGLVHMTYNIQQGHSFVCNCCPCCCGLLRGLNDYDAPYIIASGTLYAEIDSDLCTSCGICAEERCPTTAISENEGVFSVNRQRCIGCGACVPTCPAEAIEMLPRPDDERQPAPGNLLKWSMKKGASRGIDYKKVLRK